MTPSQAPSKERSWQRKPASGAAGAEDAQHQRGRPSHQMLWGTGKHCTCGHPASTCPHAPLRLGGARYLLRAPELICLLKLREPRGCRATTHCFQSICSVPGAMVWVLPGTSSPLNKELGWPHPDRETEAKQGPCAQSHDRRQTGLQSLALNPLLFVDSCFLWKVKAVILTEGPWGLAPSKAPLGDDLSQHTPGKVPLTACERR